MFKIGDRVRNIGSVYHFLPKGVEGTVTQTEPLIEVDWDVQPGNITEDRNWPMLSSEIEHI